LKILFGIPITWGVAITALDVLVIMLGSGGKTQKIFELLVSFMLNFNFYSDYGHGPRRSWQLFNSYVHV
jgi:Mn2+/Fe2+ NRAMP family transporter